MARRVQIKIEGLEELNATLRRLAKAAPQLVAEHLYRWAEEQIANEARRRYVPVVTGALRASIITQPPVVIGTKVGMIVGAGGPAAPYALSVHENPRSGKTRGISPQGHKYYPRPGQTRSYSVVGQWKYLETPALVAVSGADRTLVRPLQRDIEASARKR